MVKTASLYDNFRKTGNYAIDDVINLGSRWKLKQEGQHPLTGQRTPPISGGI